MLVYWLLLGYFTAGALLIRPPEPGKRSGTVLLLLGAMLVGLVIGLRYKVGADWETLQIPVLLCRLADLGGARNGDPGYQLLNWSVQRASGELWQVNLLCGAVFTFGLFRFARANRTPG